MVNLLEFINTNQPAKTKKQR